MKKEEIKELLQNEAQAVLNIPVTDDFEKAINLIVEQVNQKGGKLVTSGMGKAGQIAMNIATTFCSTGTPAIDDDTVSLSNSAFTRLKFPNFGKNNELEGIVNI